MCFQIDPGFIHSFIHSSHLQTFTGYILHASSSSQPGLGGALILTSSDVDKVDTSLWEKRSSMPIIRGGKSTCTLTLSLPQSGVERRPQGRCGVADGSVVSRPDPFPKLRAARLLSSLSPGPPRARTHRDKPALGLGNAICLIAWQRDPCWGAGERVLGRPANGGLGWWGPCRSSQEGREECVIGMCVPDGGKDQRNGIGRE